MIIAIDCDLRASYGVTSEGTWARGTTPTEVVNALGIPKGFHTLLFEIASPVSFNRGASGHAAMTQLAKWALWNAIQCAKLDSWWPGLLKVAPSNVWTHGYDLKTRHAMAKCFYPKKDLRECAAMIWFYRTKPDDWKTLPQYLSEL